jgi:hypothetical protein
MYFSTVYSLEEQMAKGTSSQEPVRIGGFGSTCGLSQTCHYFVDTFGQYYWYSSDGILNESHEQTRPFDFLP